jgi:hypothetical protein
MRTTKSAAPRKRTGPKQALAAYATLEDYDELLAEWRREVGVATHAERAWASAAVKKASGAAKGRSPHPASFTRTTLAPR